MKALMRSLIIILLLACVTLVTSAAGPKKMRINFKETTLKNGLRVITLEEQYAPIITLSVSYKVGSANEKKGRTGLAHLFEHMMFKGSKNVGPGEHSTLVSINGSGTNGRTFPDRTVYFQSLSSNQLDLALFLEADRMRSLEITRENLDNQRAAVKEEYRLNIDNQPYGKSQELHIEMLYDDFAYKHTVMGSMDDLTAASVEDVAEFFKIHYAPNNAVLVLVGDFKTAEALTKIKKYFEDIPRQPDPAEVKLAELEQKSERRATVEDALARFPQIDIAFKAASGNTKDFYALRLLSNILLGGQSSRLNQKLVREKEMATRVTGMMEELRGPGGFYVTATLRQNVKTEDVEAVIYEEIERLRKEPLADAEIEKAKNFEKRAFINSIQNSLGRSLRLAHYSVDYNEPDLINTFIDKVAAVTKEDLQQAANKYLVSANRTVVITVPKPKSTTK
jgi:predicted Zn-dependent peptidase